MPSCVPVPRKLSSSSSKPDGVLAALAAEGNSGIESPDVLRRHFDVDDAVVKRHRPDLRIAQVACVAQDARRLFEQAGLVEVAALEQQLIFDGPLARGDVQAIREARQRGVFVRRLGIEQVARVETDLADAGALLLRAPHPRADPAARGASGFGARAFTLGRTLASAIGAAQRPTRAIPSAKRVEI